jgi:hypothetical protein
MARKPPSKQMGLFEPPPLAVDKTPMAQQVAAIVAKASPPAVPSLPASPCSTATVAANQQYKPPRSGRVYEAAKSQRLARKLDPLPSHVAAHGVVTSGTVQRHEDRILGLLKMVGARPATTHELAKLSWAHETEPLRYDQIGKRLPDMERDGLVDLCAERKCIETRQLMQTWRLKGNGQGDAEGSAQS